MAGGPTISCYDSTTQADIPAGVPMVAGYIDGLYAWSATDWQARAGAVQVRIAVNPNTPDGDAGDVEQGDMDPASGAAWTLRRRQQGHPFPVLYCNQSSRPQVEAELTALGLNGSEAGLWIATLDGVTQQVPAGPYPVVAVQYAGQTSGSGGHYDISAVYDWPGKTGTPSTGGPLAVFEPPFSVRKHPGAHWYGTPTLADDQGPVNVPDGSPFNVVEVDSSGQFYRTDAGTWWLRFDQVGVVLGGAGSPGPQGPPGPEGPAGPQGPPGTVPSGSKVVISVEGTVQ